MRQVKLDLHTHTIASGHAYSSLQEMAQRASQLNLTYLGITEHGPAIPGTCDPIYFHNMIAIPREMYGVHLLMGAELNILDLEGRVDLNPSYYERMDLRIAGIHVSCFKGGSREENTQAVIKTIQNPWVNIISHPGDGAAELDFEALVLAAAENRTLLEINNWTMNPTRNKVGALENNLELLRLHKKHGVPLILGSDAHISFSIADYSRLWPLLEATEFPDELVINFWPERLGEYLSI